MDSPKRKENRTRILEDDERRGRGEEEEKKEEEKFVLALFRFEVSWVRDPAVSVRAASARLDQSSRVGARRILPHVHLAAAVARARILDVPEREEPLCKLLLRICNGASSVFHSKRKRDDGTNEKSLKKKL